MPDFEQPADAVNEPLFSELELRATPILGRAGGSLAEALVAQQRGDTVQASRHYSVFRTQMNDWARRVTTAEVLSDVGARLQMMRDAAIEDAIAVSVADLDLPSHLKLAPVEAFLSVIERVPVLVNNPTQMAAVIANKEFALARSTSLTFTAKVRNSLATHVATGGKLSSFVKEFRAAGMTDAYAETVYRTNLSTAYNDGQVAAASHPALRGFIVGWRYSAVGDHATRPNHKAMEGFEAGVHSPVWNVWTPPNGYNCYLPGTRVQGAFVAGSKAFYAGPAVQIDSRGGDALSVTANHPVLTWRGWLAAKDVREGDYLLCYNPWGHAINRRGDSRLATPLEARGAVHDQNVPAAIEDVFESLAAQCVYPTFSRRPPLDFHGDAACFDGEVHAVRANGMLPLEYASEFFEGVKDFSFNLGPDATHFASHSGGEPFACFSGNNAASSSGPSAATLTADDLRVIRAIPALRPLEPLCIGAAARLNASILKPEAKGVAADSEFFRKLILASSGTIAVDRVSNVGHFDFSGHVYDLQTVTGWMIAENIVTSNCRCALVPITRPEAEAADRLDVAGNFIDDKTRAVLPDPGFRGGKTLKAVA